MPRGRVIILVFGLVGLFLLGIIGLVVYNLDDAQADEGFVTYEELRNYDHDIQTKEGGFFDLWNDSKRQDERTDNMWNLWHKGQEYDNQRIQELQEQIQRLQGRTQQQKKEVVAMISNEGGQTIETSDGSVVTMQPSVNPMIRRGKEEQDRELQSLVNQAVEVYLLETGRNPSCKVGGVSVSLGDIIHAKIIQEGGYEVGSAGRRTNNPGSLRNNGVLRPVIAFHHIDSTNKWREYATMQDGIVDMAYLIDQRYDCKISINSIFAYVYGPNAERTKGRLDHVNAIYNNFYARLTK